MKVIIAGTRYITAFKLVKHAMRESGFIATEVVSGGARGVDQLGELWAKNEAIPVRRFPADWQGKGKRAGYLRNMEMCAYADALVAIWDEESKGTEHMIQIMRGAGKPVYVLRTGGGPL